jgi:O-antigen/teichoic acid export membrane protein
MDDSPKHSATLRQRVLGGGAWLGLSQAIVGLFGFGVTVVVARTLDRADYGLVAMAAVVIGLARQTNAVGLGEALVRKDRVTRENEQLTFSFALVFAAVVYLLVFVLAPLIAAFYSEPRVALLLRVMSIGFVIRAFWVVPNALIRRSLKMRKQAWVQISSSITDGTATMVLALITGSYWALAIGPLIGQLVMVVGLRLAQPWHPALRLRGEDAGEIAKFGGGVSASLMLWYWWAAADKLILGWALGTVSLGAYHMAMQVTKLTWNRVWMMLQPMMLPAFTQARRSPGESGRVLLRMTRYMALFAFPVTIGLALVGGTAVPLLLSNEWVEATGPLPYLCLLGAARSLTNLLRPILMAAGRVGIEFRFNLAAAIALPLAFLAAVGPLEAGITGVAAAWAIVFPALALTIQLPAVLEVTGLRARDYFKVLARPALAVLMMTGAVVAVGRLVDVGPVWQLACEIVTGAAVYFAAITWLEGNPVTEFRHLLRDARVGARN